MQARGTKPGTQARGGLAPGRTRGPPRRQRLARMTSGRMTSGRMKLAGRTSTRWPRTRCGPSRRPHPRRARRTATATITARTRSRHSCRGASTEPLPPAHPPDRSVGPTQSRANRSPADPSASPVTLIMDCGYFPVGRAVSRVICPGSGARCAGKVVGAARVCLPGCGGGTLRSCGWRPRAGSGRRAPRGVIGCLERQNRWGRGLVRFTDSCTTIRSLITFITQRAPVKTGPRSL
jgi:hypothetical protein